PLDPVKLHARPSTTFASARVGPRQRPAKPRAVSSDFMVMRDEANVRPLPPRAGDLRRVFLGRHPPSARSVVPGIDRRNAFGDQLVPPLMPHPFPSVEKVAYDSFLRHRRTPSRQLSR